METVDGFTAGNQRCAPPFAEKKGSSTSFFYGQEPVDSRTFLNGYSD